MRVQIATRRCDVPRPVLERAERRIQGLSRYEPRLSAAELVFEEERHTRRAEGVLSIDRDEPMVARGEGEDFRAALDQMVDRLSRMLRRRRSQRTDHQGPRHAGTERLASD